LGDESERMFVVFSAVGSGAVARHDDVEVTHVSVVCRKQHTNVTRYAGENQGLACRYSSRVSSVVEKKPECLGLRTK
jgi:hypothetical protein